MKGYKPIKHFTLQECESFLYSYPNSLFCEEVNHQKHSLLDNERKQNEERRIAAQKAQEKAQKRHRIKVRATLSMLFIVVFIVAFFLMKITINTQNDEEHIEGKSENYPAVVNPDDFSAAEENNVVKIKEDVESFNDIVTTDEAKDFILAYCDAVTNNDTNRLRKMYAYNINRYHSKYNTTIDYVIDAHNKYDEEFGVYGKRFSVQWQTLNVSNANNDGETTISIVMNYQIDRYDSSKKSNFVLKKYFVLNNNKKIVEEYDDIMETY